jgi:mono/diheme cytochrome c family protein
MRACFPIARRIGIGVESFDYLNEFEADQSIRLRARHTVVSVPCPNLAGMLFQPERRQRMRTLSIMALALGLMSPVVHAQDIDAPGDPEEGKALYDEFCATCHGIDANGRGPMAPILLVQPSDLTTLTERHGEFPITRIVMRIDGRDPLVSHGSDMPVWGDFFEGEDAVLRAETGQPIFTSRPVVDLTAFLASIQE